jgi:hypothetical protein
MSESGCCGSVFDNSTTTACDYSAEQPWDDPHRVEGPAAARAGVGCALGHAFGGAARHSSDRRAVQEKHKARFLNYWFDEATGTVTCLVEAPSAEDAVAAHKEAHGLVPEAIDEGHEGR